MKIPALILKNLREQLRSVWVLLLTLLMGPFFLFVYFLIIDSYTLHLDLLVLNSLSKPSPVTEFETDALPPVRIRSISDSLTALHLLKNGKADALLILREGENGPEPELIGDLRSMEYILTAVWTGELLQSYFQQLNGTEPPFLLRETPLGSSAVVSEFEAMVPGLIILSIIMLMFPAGIAFVQEAEQKTLIRLRLARISTAQYLIGLSAVQLLIGLLSAALTFSSAVLLGADFQASLSTAFLILSLCSLSIIAFSLLLAALTDNANQILVLGNFPMFLFMFFSGAAFPLQPSPLFEIAGYPFSLQSLMSPTHAVSALHKVLVMQMQLTDVLPELFSLLLLSALYALLGGYIFRRRHLAD